MADLGERQKLFIEEYLKDRNQTQAAIRAGYSAKTAAEQSSRLLTNVNIQAEIALRSKAMTKKAQVTAESLIAELAKGAFHELDLSLLKPSDKIKCLEILCKIEGLLDGSGNNKTKDSELNYTRIHELIERIESARVKK